MMTERHRAALSSYVRRYCTTDLFAVTDDVILFGSCARGSERFGSDIDLAVILKPGVTVQEKKREIREIVSSFRWDDIDGVECDIHFIEKAVYEQGASAFLENIKKDGVSLWQKITKISPITTGSPSKSCTKP